MTAWGALTRLSEIIAEEEWAELTPALVSSLARPAPMEDHDRPEYAALATLHGEDRIADVVFELFLAARRPTEQGLRTRCWELLVRLGEAERLRELLAGATLEERDALLLDLQAAARELGVVPERREEILWLRTLRAPEHALFWREARAAMTLLAMSSNASGLSRCESTNAPRCWRIRSQAASTSGG